MKIVFIFLLFLIYNSQTISDSNNYSIEKKLEKIIAENEELKKNNDELNQKVENLQTFIKSRKPIYRFFNDVTRDHFYSLEAEKNIVINTKPNYKYEGIAFFAFTN